jgi:dephospho-CoA kinase
VSGRLENLQAAGIQIISADVTSHFILERDGFVAFVERKGDDFGNIGAPGLMTEKGFAALVWRGGKAYFIARGLEQPATDEQVETIREFANDLESALSTQK